MADLSSGLGCNPSAIIFSANTTQFISLFHVAEVKCEPTVVYGNDIRADRKYVSEETMQAHQQLNILAC